MRTTRNLPTSPGPCGREEKEKRPGKSKQREGGGHLSPHTPGRLQNLRGRKEKNSRKKKFPSRYGHYASLTRATALSYIPEEPLLSRMATRLVSTARKNRLHIPTYHTYRRVRRHKRTSIRERERDTPLSVQGVWREGKETAEASISDCLGDSDASTEGQRDSHDRHTCMSSLAT